MLDNSELVDVYKAFARKGELLDLDIIPLREALLRSDEAIKSPVEIYTSPGEKISEEFSVKEPEAAAPVSLPPDAEYITGIATAMKIRPPSELIQKMAPTKNFLDIFFDWLNKILSGI